MVFLGTPHIKVVDNVIKERLQNILRVGGKPSPKRDLSQQNLNALYLSASQFVSALSSTKADVRVVSGYEIHPTKLATSTWSRHSPSVIVSPSFVVASVRSHN